MKFSAFKSAAWLIESNSGVLLKRMRSHWNFVIKFRRDETRSKRIKVETFPAECSATIQVESQLFETAEIFRWERNRCSKVVFALSNEVVNKFSSVLKIIVLKIQSNPFFFFFYSWLNCRLTGHEKFWVIRHRHLDFFSWSPNELQTK